MLSKTKKFHAPRVLLADGLLILYRYVIGPALHTLSGGGSGCRFEPTCSEYCAHAIRLHGVVKGGGLAIKRVLRCQPWGGSGWDPVQQAKVN